MKIISFSGGIDSTALGLLVPDAIPIFCDTHWEFPELYAHIDRFENFIRSKVLRLDGGSLPDYIQEQKFFPNFKARYCTRLFKIEPMNEFIQRNIPCDLLIGLRADEPERKGNLSEIEGLSIKYPLREMGLTRDDCIAVCEENNLLPKYPIYMKRGGCRGCYFKSKYELKAMNDLRPHSLDELQELEESIQDNRARFFYMFPNLKCSIRDFRKQLPLLDVKELYQTDLADNDPCGLFCNR